MSEEREETKPIRFTFEEQEAKRLELDERRVVLEERRSAVIERDQKRLEEDLELHRQEVQRNEERFQQREKDIKHEREEWRRHVANVEKTNELLIEVLKRISLAIEDHTAARVR